MGAMFVAGVRRFDKLTVGENGKYFSTRRALLVYLKRFFSERQIDLIEAAFEGTWHGNSCKPSLLFLRSLDEKYASKEGDVFVLRKILKNIIANKGTFVPFTAKELKQIKVADQLPA